jgi:hypothetical protein
MNPYDTASRFMPRDYKPVPTVRFDLHREIRGDLMPPAVQAWAVSNLPDGDYVAQYMITDDGWRFGRAEWEGERRRIVQMPDVCRAAHNLLLVERGARVIRPSVYREISV